MKVRRARRSDLPFIRQLLIESITESIPDRRDISGENVEIRAEAEIDVESMLRRRRDYAFLVALIDDQHAGFLILELNETEETTGEPQTLIYHIAVAPEFMGKRVDRALISEAAKLTHERGIRYMIGRVSSGNPRALLTALRQGFEVERYQIVMACGPQGGESMPGRSAEEHHHDIRRLAQKLKRREKSS